MSNMSYCRFRNTLPDLRDCRDELNNLINLELIKDEDERKAAQRLINICVEISEAWGKQKC